MHAACVAVALISAAPVAAQNLPAGGILDLPQHGRLTVTSYMPHN